MGHVLVEGSMVNRGGGGWLRSRQGPSMPQGASGVGAEAGLGLHYQTRLKVLRPVIWVSRLQRTYSQGLSTRFFGRTHPVRRRTRTTFSVRQVLGLGDG